MQGSNNPKLHYYHYGIDQLAYFDSGKGNQPTVLLIHGFGEDYRIWDAQIEYLSQYYRVIAPNLPGVHCKPLNIHHSQLPQINMYVEVMHELMHHLHIEQYYVMGHSMGGYIGLAFADYYTNHVMGLGLIHSTTYADSDAKKASRMKVAEFLEEYGTLKYLETATANLFANTFKEKHPGTIQTVIDSASDISKEAMIQFVMAMRNRRAHTHMLSQNRIPIWMIVGKEDIAVPFEDSQAQIELLAQKNVLILEQVGHMGMLEATDQVNQAMHQFIQDAITK
jgi:pimeloyl-ACP methyl ester carboxylesterase